MAVDLSANFEQFLTNISLGDPQVPRMNSAANTISGFLRESYDIHESSVFMQGSYANGTAIEPVNQGEYDIDLVAVCAAEGDEADAALEDLESRFRADGRFRDRVRRKTPCVRIEYASDDVGAFHVDVVPARESSAGPAPLEIPRRGEGWHDTAPAEYTRWCQSKGLFYLRTVKMLKRWRSEQQSVRTAIKSIVLQVLIAEHMPPIVDDADRIAETLRSLHASLDGLETPPPVINPVLASENLARRWSQESFQAFQQELKEAVEWADKALITNDPIEAADSWIEIFGDDFPTTTPLTLGFKVGDYSHAQSPRENGWSESSDPRFSVSVTATQQRGKRSLVRKPYVSNGPLIFAGHQLNFKAQLVAPTHVEVWWQVANTGGHARDMGGLRGDIFKGKDVNGKPLDDQAKNQEATSYTGSHLIRAMLVRNNNVVAKSDWFQVNIYSKDRRFHL